MNRTYRIYSIAAIAATTVIGCGQKSSSVPSGDTSSVSSAPAANAPTPPSTPAAPATADSANAGAEVKTYVFHGTPKQIDATTNMVTVEHEAIEGYKPAGVDQFTAASPEVLAQAKVGTETHFTLRVLGGQALITKVQEKHDDAHSDHK